VKCIILKGGLGNQLFQLAKFIHLKRNYFKDLKLDISSGFLLDFKYRRKFEIRVLNRKGLVTSNFQSLQNLFFLVLYKKFPDFLKLLNINVIDDHTSFEFIKLKRKVVIFNGYFQNFEIVNANLNEIYEIVKPYFEMKQKPNFQSLIDKINSIENSVALGIRFYEESTDPSKHAAINSAIKNVQNFNAIINLYEKKLKNPIFFVFVQNENEFTNKLKFNSKYYIVSHKNGFLGSWERLSAQAHCKHHIFNNSTFYYWGAIFSRFLNIRRDLEPEIYISDNFIYDAIYNPDWEKF